MRAERPTGRLSCRTRGFLARGARACVRAASNGQSDRGACEREDRFEGLPGWNVVRGPLARGLSRARRPASFPSRDERRDPRRLSCHHERRCDRRAIARVALALRRSQTRPPTRPRDSWTSRLRLLRPALCRGCPTYPSQSISRRRATAAETRPTTALLGAKLMRTLRTRIVSKPSLVMYKPSERSTASRPYTVTHRTAPWDASPGTKETGRLDARSRHRLRRRSGTPSNAKTSRTTPTVRGFAHGTETLRSALRDTPEY
jgi:hypothetical protein